MGIAVASKKSSGDDGGNSRRDNDERLWWLAKKSEGPRSEVARRLANWMDSIDKANWTNRWANLVWFRLMTGRAGGPTSYNFSSVARPSSLTTLWRRATFAAPTDNVLAQCSDALHARVYSQRPYLFVTPVDGDYKARVKSKKLTRFIDAAFYDLGLWSMIEQCGNDCRIWGTSFLKVDVSMDGKRIEASRVLDDEVVVDENELNAGPEPLHLGIRLFVNRAVLLDAAGTDPAAREAIMNAPKSANGVVMGSEMDNTDVVVLREAWARKVGDEQGRHVLSVGDYAFVDEAYDRDCFPIARLLFHQLPTGYKGQGMPEMVSGLLRRLEFQLSAIDENHRRASWPRIGIPKGSNINPSALADTSNGIYHFAGSDATFHFPEAASAAQYQYVQYLRDKIKERFRVNETDNNGREPQFKSGEAFIQQDRIADEAHVDLFQHLEDFVERVGVLVVEAAEKCRPTVRLPGRRLQEIKWDDVQLSRNSYSLRILKLSQLSQSGAAKQEKIDQWFAEGVITKAVKMRLEQVPDTEGYATIANSSPDYVEYALDAIVEDGDYVPPEPWIDLAAALESAQSRYLREKMEATPRDRLDMLLQFIFQIQELMGDAAPAPVAPAASVAAPGMPPPAPPGSALGSASSAPFGIQPPPAPPPGAPLVPFPVVPNA